ncbi:MAG: flagellar hook-associated protein FlgK [Bacteroidota bacterium]
MGMLSIGITGINAAQMGLEATQHNIANANTPGYSRQSIQQSAGIPHLTGSGYFGSGTIVDTVRRSYDQFLTAQTNSAQTSASESSAYLAKISQIDNMLGDPSAGLAPAMQGFFTGVQQVAANPSLVSARQTMLSAGQSVVSRFNALSGRLGDLYDSVNGEVSNEVTAINTFTKQIADVNAQITHAEAATDQPPNDLLDMRDQLVTELNKHVAVQTVQDSTGNFNVFMGNGQQLVVGSTVNTLQAMASSSDPERVVVGLKGQSGSVQELPETQVNGGTLGGLLSFRANSLDSAANSLGQIAASLALTFNAQHALGQDLQGLNQTSATSGFQADFFSISSPKVVPTSTSAAAVTASFLPPSVSSSGNFYTNLTGSDYVLNAASATSVTLTRKSDGQAWTAANIGALNGLIAGEGISLGGAPTVGVDYLIEPTREVARNFAINPMIASDPKRIAAGAPSVSSLGNMNTGSLEVSQGGVVNGYALANLPATFTYSQASGNFTFTFPPSGTVSATYADGTTLSIAAGAIARQNGTSAISQITYNGITVDVSGMPANNDTFTISPNTNGISDSRNAVKLANLQTQNAMAGGSSSYQASYASLVSKVGSTSSQIKVTGDAQQTLLKQNQDARSAVSGVNLDEEAANLIRFQQAYQASAKSLDIASKLFDTILAI